MCCDGRHILVESNLYTYILLVIRLVALIIDKNNNYLSSSLDRAHLPHSATTPRGGCVSGKLDRGRPISFILN